MHAGCFRWSGSSRLLRREAVDRHYIFARGVAVYCKVIAAWRTALHHTICHGLMRVVSTSAAEGVTELRGCNSTKFQNGRRLQHILGPYSPAFCASRSSTGALWRLDIICKHLIIRRFRGFRRLPDSCSGMKRQKTHLTDTLASCRLRPPLTPWGPLVGGPVFISNVRPEPPTGCLCPLQRCLVPLRVLSELGVRAAVPSISAEDFELAPLISQRCRSSYASIKS